jgi:exodeoxyribonuclease-1
VAFHSPELLSSEETALFNGYLREKWSAPDAPETEWMTFRKAQAALEELRAAEPHELDVIATFMKVWGGRGR